MKIKCWTLALVLAPACVSAEAIIPGPIPASETIHEIMHHRVMPAADVLWGATAIYITIEGEDDRSPKNDEEWNTVDQARVAMEFAIEALLVPGRAVDEPGAEVDYAAEDLKPKDIQAIIDRDPEIWVAMVHGLDATVQEAKQAIIDRNVDSLRDIGGAIDDACEACHKHFWYPKH